MTEFAHDNRRQSGTSRFVFANPLEVAVHRIEGDEQHGEGEVYQQSDQRIHEREYDGHEGDRRSDRDPLTDLPDQIRMHRGTIVTMYEPTRHPNP